MSLDAMVWALKHAPVSDPLAHLVLIGLADHAGPDGREARPSQKRLAEYVNVTDRTIRTKLRLLEEEGLIRPGDDQLVAHLRADRRPLVWDLCMGVTKAMRRAEADSGRNSDDTTTGSTVHSRPEAGCTNDRNTASDRTVHEPSSEPSVEHVGDPAADAPLVGEVVTTTPPSRPDVQAVCQVVSEHVYQVTGKRPLWSKRWETQARLMLDADGHTVEQVRAVMAWVTASSFWSPNILSVPKLREKWPTLVGQARRDANQARGGWVEREMQRATAFASGGGRQ
ncbi:helix-turn-helix domain-containing protein [Brachybacterium sp.]|uniref:helix-turn-helix domain-containing protein n=1 Tax=Brachybacterium sp. TaxID=1891286 RepID=UPI002ED63BDA